MTESPDGKLRDEQGAESPADALLSVSHVTKRFPVKGEDDLLAVSDVSFKMKRGEILAVIGESGSGKSTLVNMITGLLEVTDGSIRFDGQDITHLKGRDRAKIYRKMQMVFQSPTESFDPRYTLGDAIAESLINAGVKKKEALRKAEELLTECGMPGDFVKRYPHEVSGGQCQRASIARALAISPDLLILDEATSALDATVQADILDLLLRLKKEHDISYLFIIHDIALVQNFCDRVIVMNGGRIVEEGEVEDVIAHPSHPYTRALIDAALM